MEECGRALLAPMKTQHRGHHVKCVVCITLFYQFPYSVAANKGKSKGGGIENGAKEKRLHVWKGMGKVHEIVREDGREEREWIEGK